MDFADAEAGGIEEDFTGGLRAGKADGQENRGRRLGSSSPNDAEGEARTGVCGSKGSFATGAVNTAYIE